MCQEIQIAWKPTYEKLFLILQKKYQSIHHGQTSPEFYWTFFFYPYFMVLCGFYFVFFFSSSSSLSSPFYFFQYLCCVWSLYISKFNPKTGLNELSVPWILDYFTLDLEVGDLYFNPRNVSLNSSVILANHIVPLHLQNKRWFKWSLYVCWWI